MKISNPLQDQLFTVAEIEEIVIWTRYHLYNYGFPYGAGAIRSRLDKDGVTPLPSLSTIGRILRRNGLTYRRTGSYK
jgi:hypothetical protein